MVMQTKKVFKGKKKITSYKDTKRHVAKFLAKRRLENEREKIFDTKVGFTVSSLFNHLTAFDAFFYNSFLHKYRFKIILTGL